MPNTGAGSASRYIGWLAVALLVILLDQVSKITIVSNLHDYQLIRYTSFFDLVLVYNTGAAFSFLAQAGGWQMLFFSALALVISVIIAIALWRHQHQSRFCMALAGIMGGALGNVIDRLRLGKVIDFLQLHIGTHYWPAFNIADCAIVGGAMLLVLDSFLSKSDKHGNTP
ncbi:signal peptidase II [Leeia oryzae]|uniref:signal peptidase II n=1 Tax=Leeia oryzae TaxID=356662 RepID=UPI000369C159|nr:signal peptidase II [Leeia oryzae]